MNRVIILEDEQARKDLAEQHLVLINMLDLENQYVRGDDISSLLNITRRQWNRIVEDVLHLYVAGVLDKLLIGTRKGFIYTNDEQLIDKFITARRNHFKSQAYNTYAVFKKFKNRNNATLEEFLDS